MAEYWLCDAGDTLRGQIDKRWPKRDRASDGWIGDASHAAVKSDHNPDWDAGGVVRAIDVDSDLDKANPDTAQKLANQIIGYARAHKDGARLSYVIFDHKIASGTYSSTYWTWRPYTGSDPHTNHIHVSFLPRGDHRGGEFNLPIFTDLAALKASRLKRLVRSITDQINRLRGRRSRKLRQLQEIVK